MDFSELMITFFNTITDGLSGGIMAVHLTVVISLFVLGLHFFYLTYWAWRAGGDSLGQSDLHHFPLVTVQLPLYNERYVARRLIEAVARLDWPRDQLEIQVLNDSNDDTGQIVEQVVATLRAEGLDIHHFCRTTRAGFKAGALAYGLYQARGEFIAIFDADFLPPSDFLRRTLPYFADPQVGFVQTRWGHLNYDYSFLTRLQGLALDSHFLIDQRGRDCAGLIISFNGTAGIWRRAAIEEAGGWLDRTLTEDLDLSYRAQLIGWRGCFLHSIITPAELPVTIEAYRQQQHRWAKGGIECARLFLYRVLTSSLPWQTRLAAAFHLTANLSYLLLLVLTLLHPLFILALHRLDALHLVLWSTLLLNLGTLAPLLYFAMAVLHQRPRRELGLILMIPLLGAGMMLNNGLGVLEALLRHHSPFLRTPKGAISDRTERWQDRHYLHLSRLFPPRELTLAIYALLSALFSIKQGYALLAFYPTVFAAGLFLVSGITIQQQYQQWLWTRRRSSADPRGIDFGL
jgi:cellulose synthase/poly-beta-1,6-N-acetylglucosamine synthase-like glycosyltransferase